MEDLIAALDRAGADPSVRAVLITGARPGFQAGQDLGEVAGCGSGTFSEYLAGSWDPVITGLWNLAKPTVAAVNGPAIGAGVALVLACDLIVASDRAAFTSAFTRLGFCPDAGISWPHSAGGGDGPCHGTRLPGRDCQGRRGPNGSDWSTRWLPTTSCCPGRPRSPAPGRRPHRRLGQAERACGDATADSTLGRGHELEGRAQDVAGAAPDSHEGVAAFLENDPAFYSGR